MEKNVFSNTSYLNERSWQLSLSFIVFIHGLFLINVTYHSLKPSTFSKVESTNTSIKASLIRYQVQVKKPEKKVVKKANKKSAVKTPQITKDNIETKTTEQTISAGKNNALDNYRNQVRELVKEHKVFPRIARRLKRQGKVLVEVIIQQSGNIQSLSFIQKSDFDVFNDASKSIFKRIKSFKKFPEEIKDKEISVKVPIDYILL